jgi:hypothetical protein
MLPDDHLPDVIIPYQNRGWRLTVLQAMTNKQLKAFKKKYSGRRRSKIEKVWKLMGEWWIGQLVD